MTVISFISVKGGVGKTTLALETASSLANHFGKRVLLVDANFSAPNLDLYLGLEHEVSLHDVLKEDSGHGLHKAIYEKYGFDIVPASLFYKCDVDIFGLQKSLARIKKRYDFVILDSSPNYKELVPVVAASDKIFVVTTPDFQTLNTSMKAAQIAKKKETPIQGIIVNKIRNPKFELSLKDIERQSEIPVVARIEDDKKMSEALYHQKPLTLHDEMNKISREIRSLASALVGSPEKKGFFQKFVPNFLKGFIGKEKVNRELMRKEVEVFY